MLKGNIYTCSKNVAIQNSDGTNHELLNSNIRYN